jgi:hypothetical protein
MAVFSFLDLHHAWLVVFALDFHHRLLPDAQIHPVV